MLDLGKRNKMISFRETKRATLKILKPGFEDLYQKIVVDEKELTFQKAIDKDSDIRVYSILSLLDKLSSPIEVNIGDIRADGSLPEIKKTLKHLRSKARLALDEQGTNILYLVFGFIEWREKGNRSDNWIKSPLLLVPVSLQLPSLNAQYSLKKYEDEVVVNPTLAYLFERDYGITLPEFDSDKDSLESFMQEMEKLVNDRGWRILRECSMGLVSFLKISMYNDLIRNEEPLKANPIVRAFAGEQNEVNSPTGDAYEFDHDACRAVDFYQVLAADSSQQDAIMLSHKGASFVMQGPPGTGKSQTITNIIAQGLADGKKILFVSEKMAALDVVYRRLTDVQLDDFCLSLHSHKANKKEILAQLGNNLSLPHIKVKDEEIAKLSRLDMIKEHLKAYVKDIHTTIMPLEMSLYEVYGAILELGNLPDIDLHLPDVEQMTKDQVNRLALLVMNLDKAQGVLGPQWYKNPWQGITVSYLEVSQKRELQNKLQDSLRMLSAFEECKLADKTLAEILTLDTLDSFWDLCEHARYCTQIPTSWFSRSTEQEEKLVQSLLEYKKQIDALRKVLSEKYDHDFFELDGAQSLAEMTNAVSKCRSMLRHTDSDEAAFGQLEKDYNQLQQLHELSELLSDAFHVLSKAYNLALPCEASSIETALTICSMLLEKRNVTASYFETAYIRDYADSVHNTLTLLEKNKLQLCERYDDSILAVNHINQRIQQVDTALAGLDAVNFQAGSDYAILNTISAFDEDALLRIKEALSNPVIEEVNSKYGVDIPDTLKTVLLQITALELLPKTNGIQRWKSAYERSNAKKLIGTIIDRKTKLCTAKDKLGEYFSKTGIVLDVEKFTSDELKKLYQAHKQIPEAAVIIESCGNREAYELLDSIARNSAERNDLEQQLADVRKEYHIKDSLSHAELLAVLQAQRNNAECCSPSAQWAESQMDAYDLLNQVIALSNGLRKRHNELTAIYEDTVFTLDYAAMLNRFKAEYTSFFKIFKSEYKNDVKQIRLVFKEVRKKIPDDEIISLLQTLRQYHENLETYRNLTTKVTALLDVKEYDIWYDWEIVRHRLDAFSGLCPSFDGGKDAYNFIIKAPWDHILSMLRRFEELRCWFADNEKAKLMFGSLYKQHRTDTLSIKELLDHAGSVCVMFVSPAHYLSFLNESETHSFNSGVREASTIVDTRGWFASRSDEIKEYTGIVYDESSDPWKDVLAKLKIYDDIASAFGEQVTHAFVTQYSEDKLRIESYRACLQTIASIEVCAKSVCNVERVGDEVADMQISVLLDHLYEIIKCASQLIEVYAFISSYCPTEYGALCTSELKHDLEAVQFYQNAMRKLDELDDEYHTILGSDYSGAETDWFVVEANISFCERVNTLLGGNHPAELVSAFVNGSSVYSALQASELQQYWCKAKEIESTYREITCIKGLEEKIQILSEILQWMRSALRVKNAVISNAFVPCTYSSVMEDLGKLASLQIAQMSYSEDLPRAQKRMPTFGLSTDTNWENTAEVFSHLKQVKRAIRSDGVDPEITQWVSNGIPGISVYSYYPQIEQLVRHKSDLTDITSMFTNRNVLESYNFLKLSKRFNNCNDQFATMDAWIDLRDCKKACQDKGLGDFVLQAEDAFYPDGALKDVFLKSFYYQWFEKTCADVESVANFRVRTQNTRVETFRDLDARQLPVDQMRIRERLIRDMPSKHNFGRATDEMSVLLHELGKKRNIMPLRKLFRTIPNLLLRLKPCLMMSPLSVSYFLEAETYKFDMVIFDEASQIFPQDAIGAIFRGAQVIIAGDSKQLPPTNFFAASTNNDADFDVDDENEEDIIFDSILEEATNSLPNRSLLWHYRSRFEELISFSNQEIYQNNLITFPSSTTQAADTGVEYVYVKNGVYENRCNRTEAQEIVRLVAEHIKKHPDRSLGIIAFSESQQSIIEEEINKFRTRNPFYELFFDENKDEPFFVKNLENVQGDERDTIIFSICYGKNSQGRMYMRFGPLGHQGGERRLNVAITRAKTNIKLVGSILPEDIDLSKTHSEGVRMLRSYINFALQGNSALIKHSKKNSLYDVDVFSEQVGKFLTQNGCKIQMNIGSSDYTIDIAVEHPKRPGHFIAGIECDGNSYYMARTVRDRDHLRPAVLERMGWKMYRVWSTEWIRNPGAEQERLMQFIRDALLHYGEGGQTAEPVPEPVDSIATEVVKHKSATHSVDSKNPYNFPKYVEGEWWNRTIHPGDDNLSRIAASIRAVVKVEQPIHMELLYKRVGASFTTGRATQAVRDTIDSAIQKRMRGEVVIEDQFIRFTNFTNVQVRMSEVGCSDRPIEYISIPEIAAAMERILDGAFGIERSVLCSEAARVFGFERNGQKIKQRTNEAVDYLEQNRKISVYDGKIQLLEG